ncbi:MAG: hypothetical protein R2867_42820 [Caldilineaceae bacterium]
MSNVSVRARDLAHLANYTYHLNTRNTDLSGLHAQLQQLHLALHVNPGNPFYDMPSGHHGYMAVTDKDTVVAIRGSGEPDDWRNNLRFWQESYWLGAPSTPASPSPHEGLPKPSWRNYSAYQRFMTTRRFG